MDRLTNKVTLITGAASGIGKATAELFHREGAIIILSDINHKAGSEITKKLKKRATYFHLDVSKEEEDYEKGMADIPIAILPRTSEISLLQMDGIADKEQLKKAIDLCKKACKKI